MFRIGGSAEGITSGLAPRQGYAHKPGHVTPNDPQKLGDIRNMDIGQLKELAGTMAYKPRGTNVYDFMTEFGLDIASRSPVPGGILATAATSAKEPYSRFMERKGTAAEQQYASESGMFKTLIEGAAAATGDEGVQWQKQWELQQIGSLMDEIATLSDIKERTKEQDLELAKAEETKLKEKEDFKTLYEKTAGEMETYKSQADKWTSYETSKREALLNSIPEEEKEAMSKLDLETLEFVTNKINNAKANAPQVVGSPRQPEKPLGDWTKMSLQDKKDNWKTIIANAKNRK